MIQSGCRQFSDASINDIANALSQHGYIILPNALSTDLLDGLQHRVKSLSEAQWCCAGVGRRNRYKQDKEIRSDHLYWISVDHPTESTFLLAMETLRQALNQRLYLGLFDFECHFARYPAGAYYRKHIDALKGQKNRVLSAILYLNKGWHKSDGGSFLLYPEFDKDPIQTVLPESGTLVLFLSEQFPHEVLESHRQRYSLTGWYRINNNSNQADPAR